MEIREFQLFEHICWVWLFALWPEERQQSPWRNQLKPKPGRGNTGFNDTTQSTKTSLLCRQENLCAWLICGRGRKVYKSAWGSSHLMLHKNIMQNWHRLRGIIAESKNPQNLFVDKELKNRGDTKLLCFLGLVLIAQIVWAKSELPKPYSCSALQRGQVKRQKKKGDSQLLLLLCFCTQCRCNELEPASSEVFDPICLFFSGALLKVHSHRNLNHWGFYISEDTLLTWKLRILLTVI